MERPAAAKILCGASLSHGWYIQVKNPIPTRDIVHFKSSCNTVAEMYFRLFLGCIFLKSCTITPSLPLKFINLVMDNGKNVNLGLLIYYNMKVRIENELHIPLP